MSLRFPFFVFFTLCLAAPAIATDFSSDQQKSINAYLLAHEQPKAELMVLADRSHIKEFSTKTLKELFPGYSFVVIPWMYKPAPGAQVKYQIPAGLADILAIGDGKTFAFHNSGNYEEYGAFLHTLGVKVATEDMAAKVTQAFIDIHGLSLCCKNIRRSKAEWRLGYHEDPFRAISSYEEIREAYYYLLTLDDGGVVVSGKLMADEIERRKIKQQ